MLASIVLAVIVGSTCLGDVDRNGVVDVDDLMRVVNDWGSCTSPNPCDESDFDHSGVVDNDDLFTVVNNWGVCPGMPVAARLPGTFRIGDATSEGSHFLATNALDYGVGRTYTQLTFAAWVRIEEGTADSVTKGIFTKRTRADSDARDYPFFCRVLQTTPTTGLFHQSITAGNHTQDWHYSNTLGGNPADLTANMWYFLSWRVDINNTQFADLFTGSTLYGQSLATNPTFTENLATLLSIGGESGTYAGATTTNRFIKADIAHAMVYSGLVPDATLANLAAGQSPLRAANRSGSGWALLDYWSMQNQSSLGTNNLPGNIQGDLTVKGGITAVDGPPGVENMASVSYTPTGTDVKDCELSEAAASSLGESTLFRMGASVGNSRRRTLWSVNLISLGIPSNATITNCTLTLTCTTAPAAQKDLQVCFMTRDNWDEFVGAGGDGSGATWGDYSYDGVTAGLNPWTAAGGDFTTTNSITFSNGISSGTGAKAFDITSIALLAMSAHSGLMDLMLKATAGDESESVAGISIYASSENATAGNRPKLDITYTLPSGNAGARTLALLY